MPHNFFFLSEVLEYPTDEIKTFQDSAWKNPDQCVDIFHRAGFPSSK